MASSQTKCMAAAKEQAHLHEGWPATGLRHSAVCSLPAVTVLKTTLGGVILIAVVI